MLPDFFSTLLEEQYGNTLAQQIVDGCSARRAVSLRANGLLSGRDKVQAALDGAGITWNPVPWYEDAFSLPDDREDAIRALPIYDRGEVYLQSLSSMIPPLVLDARPGEDVLDMCAAPGGKTTQIAALSQGKAHLTACEMHAPRAEKLEHNLRKLGASNVVVMRTDARRLDDFFRFDRILVDAPCSGSGTLRADDARVASRFTPRLIDKSRSSQRALLSKALSIVKPGGIVVYSTCSVLACENEEIVVECLRTARRKGDFEVKPIELPGAQGMPFLPSALEGSLCLAPTDLYEGFFVALVKRNA